MPLQPNPQLRRKPTIARAVCRQRRKTPVCPLVSRDDTCEGLVIVDFDACFDPFRMHILLRPGLGIGDWGSRLGKDEDQTALVVL